MKREFTRTANIKSAILAATLILPVVLGCGMIKNAASRGNSAKFNPYTGSLSDLLQSEIKGSLVTFKSQGSRDVLSTFPGAKEAKGFTYMQDGAGVQVPVDGVIINYPTAAEAETTLSKLAGEFKATLTSRGKGKKFSADNGSTVGWTNGTIVCYVKSRFAKPSGNFEEAAPF